MSETNTSNGTRTGTGIVARKRTRKKVCEIDSIEKLKSDKIEKAEPNVQKELPDTNKSEISFGKFNITIKKKETMTPEELRAYYDKKFKISEQDKVAKLMVQEDDNVIYEPMMEGTIEIKNNIGEKRTIERTSERTIEKPGVHRVLSKFINETSTKWPDSTDILCWWCCHSFETQPLPCPIDHDPIRNRYKVNGVFCSWPCVAAYSIKEYTSITLVYQMSGLDHIDVAPPKFCLRAFGGHMSIKDFRKYRDTKKMLISTEGISYVNQEIIELKN
jgi:hypothetical protein